MELVPPELRTGPFTVAYARDVGVKWDSLQTQSWRRLSRGQYSWTGLRHDVELKLRAALHRLTCDFAFSGATAAWIHGLDMPPCEPIEVTVPRRAQTRARAGIRVRRAELADQEVMLARGFRATNALRTVRDLGSRADLVESVVAIEMALHAGLVDLAALVGYVQSHPGSKGIRRLRRALGLVEPRSESPMETRLRLALIRARLPKPSVQVDLHAASGRFLGRADLYYPDARLVIEFDGQGHRDRLTQDVRRQNDLVNAGYHILRFTAADLMRKDAVSNQVRQARKSLLRHTLG